MFESGIPTSESEISTFESGITIIRRKFVLKAHLSNISFHPLMRIKRFGSEVSIFRSGITPFGNEIILKICLCL